MDNQSYEQDDMIFALATPLAESAIAMIRTSGQGVIQTLANYFSDPKALLNAKHRNAVFGKLLSTDQTVLDEVVALVYRAPGGYTGEEAVEMMCHGSLPGIELILNALSDMGLRSAAPGEFTYRAFMNGKMDLTQAEAVHELVSSRSAASHQMALSRLAGNLSQRIDQAKSLLVKAAGAISIQLDYPGDEVDDELFLPVDEINQAEAILQTLLEGYRVGKLYRDGVQIALCGKTNSGKSSLFNLFLKEDRSIVSDVHGTTRDYLESWIEIEGVPIRLFDTAGLRQTEDPIEAEGIRRTKAVIDGADFILYVVDSTVGADQEDLDWIEQAGERCQPIWNKVDLGQEKPAEGWLPLSTTTGEGFLAIQQWVVSHFAKRQAKGQEAVIDSQRQKNLLQQAVDALHPIGELFCSNLNPETIPLDGVAMDLNEALNALGELTGEVTSVDILEQMFSDFCVGK